MPALLARPPVVGAAQGLAIHGNHLSLGQPVDAAHPCPEAVPEAVRVDAGKHPGKGVGAGDAIGQLQEPAEPLNLRNHSALHWANNSTSSHPSAPATTPQMVMVMMSSRLCRLPCGLLGSAKLLKCSTKLVPSPLLIITTVVKMVDFSYKPIVSLS